MIVGGIERSGSAAMGDRFRRSRWPLDQTHRCRVVAAKAAIRAWGNRRWHRAGGRAERRKTRSLWRAMRIAWSRWPQPRRTTTLAGRDAARNIAISPWIRRLPSETLLAMPMRSRWRGSPAFIAVALERQRRWCPAPRIDLRPLGPTALIARTAPARPRPSRRPSLPPTSRAACPRRRWPAPMPSAKCEGLQSALSTPVPRLLSVAWTPWAELSVENVIAIAVSRSAQVGDARAWRW